MRREMEKKRFSFFWGYEENWMFFFAFEVECRMKVLYYMSWLFWIAGNGFYNAVFLILQNCLVCYAAFYIIILLCDIGIQFIQLDVEIEGVKKKIVFLRNFVIKICWEY